MASRLTTVDNPFDPFTEFKQWFTWDQMAGYDTPGYLARITLTSEELSDADQDALIEAAIDEILEEHPNGIYKRASPPRTEGEEGTKV